MATYTYRAINPRGRTIRGSLVASNELELYQSLRAIGLELIDCREQRQRRSLSFGERVTNRDLIQLALHLEEMSRAGVPLLDALSDVRDSTAKPSLATIISQIHREVSEGSSLSVAFGRHPRVFGPVFVSLISAGEETGQMTESFHQLVKHLKWTDAMVQKVRKSLRYPAILSVVVLTVITFMMSYLVPQVVGFLGNLGEEPPIHTRALIATAAAFSNFWWLILGGPVALVFGLRMAVRMSDGVAYRVDYMILRAPILGDVVRKIALSRFAHMFAIMFNSGIDLLSCLAAARALVDNRALGEAVELLREQVKTGVPLSAAMQGTGEFPALIVRMVRIGEDTGTLGRTLDNIGDIYDRDTDDAIQGMISMVEPLLTAIMGILLGWIALAVFGPIYDSLGKFGR
ncbi:MAG: hypothetical protein RLY86_209 [Pseudomonadota bacterium]|jgi:type IV pilus assembly protein PilC